MSILIKSNGRKILASGIPTASYGNYALPQIDGNKHITVHVPGREHTYLLHMGFEEAQRLANNMLRILADHGDKQVIHSNGEGAWWGKRFNDPALVPIYKFAVVPKDHPDLKVIQEAYRKRGVGIGVDHNLVFGGFKDHSLTYGKR